MKKAIVFTLFLLLAGIVYADIDVTTKCETLLCIEDSPVVFSFFVSNTLSQPIEIAQVFLIDKDISAILVQSPVEAFISPNRSVTINLTKPIGLPREGYTHYFYPCINVSFSGTNVSRIVCGSVERSLTVSSHDSLECLDNTDCASGEFCHPTRNQCEKLSCAQDEAVLAHACMKLSCEKDERIINHSCVPLPSDIEKVWVYLAFSIFSIGIIIIIIILFRHTHREKVVIYEGRTKRIRRR